MAAATSAVWQSGPALRRDYRLGWEQDLPVTRQAITYVLLIPLAIFAVHGGFSFEHASWNSDLGAVGGKLAVMSTEAETLRDRLQAWIALAICLVAMIPQYRRITAVGQRMLLVAILPVYAMLSAFWSQDPGLSFRSGLSLFVTTLFALYLACRFTHRQQMSLVMLTGACVSMASIAVVLFWPQFGLDHQLHEGAWQGLFTQKNVCAESTLFMLTPALALRGTGRYGQLLQSLYIFMCLVVIFMTQSRTGWAITLLYFAFTAGVRVLGRFERKDMLPLAGSLFAAMAGIVVLAVDYPSLIFSVFSRSDTLSGRAQIWTAISASILRRPIGGYGFDAFWSLTQGEASRVFASTGWVVTSAHNGFLNVGLELGFVGVALVGILFFQAFRHANKAFHPGHSGYIEWCIGIVFLTVVYNLDERTLMATQYLPWILFTVACVGLQRASRASLLGFAGEEEEAS
jgi:O-antigen ligase